MQDLNLIIEQCRRSDPLAWETLVRHFQARVYAVCLYYLRDKEEAADAAQEAFIKVYGGIRRFRGGEKALLPWLMSLTRNCCLDRLRKSSTRARYEDCYVAETAADDTGASGRSDPEAVIRQGQEQAMLYSALEKIGQLNRDILLLREIQGLRDKEVATILDLPVGTIKSRSHRAKIQLGRLLGQLKG